MGYMTAWIVVGIITMGIYKLFELFVGRKERLSIIEKLSENKLDASMLGNKFNFPVTSSPVSFSGLKLGSLLLGMGLGILVGYIICAATIPDYFSDHSWRIDDLTSLIYGSSVLFFGGLALIIAFVVELKITRKERTK